MENLRDWEKKMFYEKDQEIERLKANLEELQLKYALDK